TNGNDGKFCGDKQGVDQDEQKNGKDSEHGIQRRFLRCRSRRLERGRSNLYFLPSIPVIRPSRQREAATDNFVVWRKGPPRFPGEPDSTSATCTQPRSCLRTR